MTLRPQGFDMHGIHAQYLFRSGTCSPMGCFNVGLHDRVLKAEQLNGPAKRTIRYNLETAHVNVSWVTDQLTGTFRVKPAPMMDDSLELVVPLCKLIVDPYLIPLLAHIFYAKGYAGAMRVTLANILYTEVLFSYGKLSSPANWRQLLCAFECADVCTLSAESKLLGQREENVRTERFALSYNFNDAEHCIELKQRGAFRRLVTAFKFRVHEKSPRESLIRVLAVWASHNNLEPFVKTKPDDVSDSQEDTESESGM